MVQNGSSLTDWTTQFFAPMANLLDHIAWFPVRGNHDGESALAHKMAPMPNQRSWYATSIYQVRLLVLDTNLDVSPGSEQMEWLADQTDSIEWKNASLRVVAFHHPPFTSYWQKPGYNGEPAVRDYLLPVLLEHGVDLILAGHAHLYERGRLMNAYQRPTHIITTGGAGGGLDRMRTAFWPHIERSEILHHILVLDFFEHKSLLEVIGTDDALMGQMQTIEKIWFSNPGPLSDLRQL